MSALKDPDNSGERFIQLLRQAGIEADYRRIEEMLWLSRLLPVTDQPAAEPADPNDTTPITSVPPQTPAPSATVPQSSKPAPRTPRLRKPANEEQVYLNRTATDGEGLPASKVRVPAPAALPDSLELMRVLRPFRRRVLSRQRRELHEEETVIRTAERGILTPAYLPVRERWFDVALVVEEKPSMAIWRQPLQEFQRVLERLSAFREVRSLRLALTEGKARLLTPAGQSQPLETIADPYGRRLIFLVTDGVSAAWQNGEMGRALTAWGRTMPVVVVQMLSEQMWHLTPLGKPSAQVSARAPGAANQSLDVARLWEAESAVSTLPFPLVVLHPASLGRWAKAVLAGSINTPAVMLSELPHFADEMSETEESLQELSAEELVARFQYLASPTAFQLAVYLSAVPLQIPIMRLVQRVMLRESRLEHLSEFLLGGLVERKDKEDAVGIEEVEFVFRRDRQDEGVQPILQREIRKGEMQRLYRSVAEYIEERYGQPFDFFALIADQKGTLRVPAEALPFTEAAEPLLRRFGIAPRDVRRFNLPAPSEGLSGLEPYMKIIGDEFVAGRRAFYLTGAAGCGKTDLALSWAQQVKKGFHTAHYFLDLGGSTDNPLTTEAALSSVIQAFQPETELPMPRTRGFNGGTVGSQRFNVSSDTTIQELQQLYQSVLHKERALLVLDDVGDQVKLDLLLPPEDCLCVLTSRYPRSTSGVLVIVVEDRESQKQIAPGPVTNDPWKHSFGGASERNHRNLSATVEPLPHLPNWFSLTLTVNSTAPEQHPLRGVVQFYLHPTFSSDKRSVNVSEDSRQAVLQIRSWGAFTVGVIADGGATLLELDLAEQPDLPLAFRQPVWERDEPSREPTTEPDSSSAQLLQRQFVEAQRNLLEIVQEVLEYQAQINALDITAGPEWERLNRAMVAATQRRLWLGQQTAEIAAEFKARSLTPLATIESLLIQTALPDTERLSTQRNAVWEGVRQYLRARNEADEDKQAAALYGLGGILAALGDHQSALSYYEYAQGRGTDTPSPAIEFDALIGMAESYIALEDFDKADRRLERASELAEKLADQAKLLRIKLALGDVRFKQQEFAQAIDEYDQALIIARKLSDEAGEHNVMGKLAEASVALGKLPDAIGFYKRQLSLARDFGDHQSECYVLGKIAETYLALNELQNAIEFYQQQKNNARAISHQQVEGEASFNLAKLFESLGEREHAIEYAEVALKLFEELNAPQAEQARELLMRSRHPAALSVRAVEPRAEKQADSEDAAGTNADDSQRLSESLAEQAKLEQELRLAAEMQARLLPVAPPDLPGYDLAFSHYTHRTFGGDYCDFIARPDGRMAIAVGDVSGKGLPAALLMSSLHAVIRTQAGTSHSAIEIVKAVNKYIYDQTQANKFVTLFYSELDLQSHQLTYVNAGHNPPRVVRASSQELSLATSGFPLGIMDSVEFRQEVIQLEPGDVLVAYTDGVTESFNEQAEEFGENRLAEIAQRQRARSATELRDALSEALRGFAGEAERMDDQTFVILKRLDSDRLEFRLEPYNFDSVTLDAHGKVKERRKLQARQFVEELAPSVTLDMVEIPGGTFTMGAPKSEKDSYGDERPQHQVTVSPFYIGKFTITQAQWSVVAGWPKVERELQPGPSHFPRDKRRKKTDDDCPVEQVSWEDAQEFCARLSNKTGRLYRLPTEAEWEYACRAGTTTPFAFGETITPEFVNYNGEYPYGKAPKGKNRGETVPVGSPGVANAFGLFDMHGNVWEWCQDWFASEYYAECEKESAQIVTEDGTPIVTEDGDPIIAEGAVTKNPQGPAQGEYRVLRGGAWNDLGKNCRSASRHAVESSGRNHGFGFRVVVSARINLVQDVFQTKDTVSDDRGSRILWVDDRPENNDYERKAFEAEGLSITLALSTNDALKKLSQQRFAAIISDMGRREGPREGYVLLDALRRRGDQTPLFFYAASNAPEHRKETLEHGGQGCTNDAKELLQMVTQAVLRVA